MDAVIAGAKQIGVWDAQNGAWDVPGQSNCMRACVIYSIMQGNHTPKSIGTIRLAGGLFKTYTSIVALRNLDQRRAGGIKVVEKTNRMDLGAE